MPTDAVLDARCLWSAGRPGFAHGGDQHDDERGQRRDDDGSAADAVDDSGGDDGRGGTDSESAGETCGDGGQVRRQVQRIDRSRGRTEDFQSGIDFGNGVSVTGNPAVDGYVAKLDVDGSGLWARAFGAEQWGNGSEVEIDDVGAVYVAGSFRDTMTIDGHTLEMADDYDTVLMKLCP